MSSALSDWLIRHAAHRAPLDLSDRLAEEWQADCGARSTALSQLRFALGCCWASRVLAREHGTATILVVAAAKGTSIALDRPGEESALISRRSSLFFMAAGLHVALFYVLMTGFAFRMIAAMGAHP
jgi:hypothetical protein